MRLRARQRNPKPDRVMEQLLLLDPADLAMLLALSPMERLGGIVRLNAARYANRLNAVVLMSLLSEARAQVPSRGRARNSAVPVSSAALPASSDAQRAGLIPRVISHATSKD